MRYVKVLFDDGVSAFQEVDPWGTVKQYLNAAGELLFEQPPINVGCAVVDENPPLEAWMTQTEST